MYTQFEKELLEYITKELNEIKINIQNTLNTNIENKKNNIFCSFDDQQINKYLVLGRSFDSQLGTRLQHIALFLARKRYGLEYVPNLMIITYDTFNNRLVVKTVTDPLDKGYQQKILWATSLQEADNLICYNRKKYKKIIQKCSKSIFLKCLKQKLIKFVKKSNPVRGNLIKEL